MLNANVNINMGFNLIGRGKWSTLKKGRITISQEQLDHKGLYQVHFATCTDSSQTCESLTQ